ncbi:hypothetical protein PR202_ga07834 [Eleusine coracana subsp. coracana]|uniref:CCHC-type domain-containing protein n=1 Tax=Eleusine coracana subsp. coracana TaxID=191504 RepID=A0AAV5BZ26_ELECO|nr:hypothetical protein PR202_ga07834 [Eleusine coracana subsp. coracana]
MTRRCSHCSHNGHNSRTCPNRGVKIFGVRLTDGAAIRKSASMGNLSLLSAGSTSGGASPADGPDGIADAGGYASDDFVQGSSSASRERKKVGTWTTYGPMEDLYCLIGWTTMFGKAQVFPGLKKNTGGFYLDYKSLEKSMDLPPLPGNQESDAQVLNQPPLPPPREEEVESMESDTSVVAESSAASTVMPENLQPSYPVILPAYFSPFLQFSVPFWPDQKDGDELPQETHEIVKPIPVHSKEPINVDELVGMSKLSIDDSDKSLGMQLCRHIADILEVVMRQHVP